MTMAPVSCVGAGSTWATSNAFPPVKSRKFLMTTRPAFSPPTEGVSGSVCLGSGLTCERRALALLRRIPRRIEPGKAPSPCGQAISSHKWAVSDKGSPSILGLSPTDHAMVKPSGGTMCLLAGRSKISVGKRRRMMRLCLLEPTMYPLVKGRSTVPLLGRKKSMGWSNFDSVKAYPSCRGHITAKSGR